jgi:hypothetical protein
MNDASENKNLEADFSRESGDNMSNDMFILQPIWLRFSVQDGFRLDEFLLAYGRDFLPRIGLFFAIIFLLQKIL